MTPAMFSFAYLLKTVFTSVISFSMVIIGFLAADLPSAEGTGLVAFGTAGLVFVTWKLIGENKAQKEIREGFKEVIDEKDQTILSKNTEIELLQKENSRLRIEKARGWESGEKFERGSN